MNLSKFFLSGSAALLMATSAHAAAMVLGESTAHTCFVHAEVNFEPANSIATCTQALSEGLSIKDKASTYVNRGILRAHVGDTAGAMADYDSAIALDDTLAEAYIDRSAALIALKRYSEALQTATRAIELGGRRSEIAFYNRAIANEELGNIRAAYEDYKAAVAVEPNFTAASQELTRFRVVKSPNGT